MRFATFPTLAFQHFSSTFDLLSSANFVKVPTGLVCSRAIFGSLAGAPAGVYGKADYY